METVQVPKEKFERYKMLEDENQSLRQQVQTLRNTGLYKRLLEFHENIKQKRFTRKDLSF